MAVPWMAGSRRQRLSIVSGLLLFVVVFTGYSHRHGSDAGTPGPDSWPPPSTNMRVGTGGGPEGGPGSGLVPPDPPHCPKFEALQQSRPGPLSTGKRRFPLVRPPPECRTFNLSSMEALLVRMRGVIHDPDLFRLFENSYPNTLDTMIKWHGFARAGPDWTGAETDEELTYVITGDIDAMWLRDSASQMYSYLPLLEADKAHDSLAGLWRGLINAHARYINISPYCHSFQPPPESGIPPTLNAAYSQNNPQPPYDPKLVFDCKWELDSLASFLQVSAAYYQRTGDLTFFQRYRWVAAVRAAVNATSAMRLGTYARDGKVEFSAWTFTGWTNRGSETLTNDGLGNPSRENGMVRSAFRPSDDACIFQFLVPANMMFAAYLEQASAIMKQLKGADAAATTLEMRELAAGIRRGIDRDAVVQHREFGDIFAYEVDGFGGVNLMDDANVPSLLAMPLFNFSRPSSGQVGSSGPATDAPEAASRDYGQIYRNTRRFVLSDANPYFAKGPVLSAVGGPHVGPGKAWPMAAVVAGLTAYDLLGVVEESRGGEGPGSKTGRTEADTQAEVAQQLRMVLDSTAGSGVVHESVNAWNGQDWTRSWFGWANGLFGELILRIEQRERGKTDGLLSRSWQ